MLALAIRMWEGMQDATFVLPSCTAEELLIGIILDRYALDGAGFGRSGAWFLDLEDLFLEDLDYLVLYNIEIAQLPDVLTALESELFMVNLGFASWFEPVRKSQKVPGPASELVLRGVNGE